MPFIIRRSRVPALWGSLALVAVLCAAAAAALALLPAGAQARASAGWSGMWVGESGLGNIELVLSEGEGKVSGSLYVVSRGSRQETQRFDGTTSVEDGRQVVRGKWLGTPGGHWAGDSGVFWFALAKDGKSIDGDTDVGGFLVTRKGAKPTPAPATTQRADTSLPVVRAYPPDRSTRPGATVSLRFTVKDDSGKATVAGTLFEGGKPIRTMNGPVKATGGPSYWNAPLAGDLVGPLYYCVSAKDAAGNSSRGAPQSSCAWIPMVVDIAKVSNGCGGSGWKWFVAGQNYVGNSEVFDEPGGASYTVSFVPACNLHDAGYGGHMVLDSLNGNVPLDYRNWSRKRVDDKFRSDMAKLCEKIPAHAETARIRCRSNWRYQFVRKAGWAFFDADLRKPDVQSEGTRDNS